MILCDDGEYLRSQAYLNIIYIGMYLVITMYYCSIIFIGKMRILNNYYFYGFYLYSVNNCQNFTVKIARGYTSLLFYHFKTINVFKVFHFHYVMFTHVINP